MSSAGCKGGFKPANLGRVAHQAGSLMSEQPEDCSNLHLLSMAQGVDIEAGDHRSEGKPQPLCLVPSQVPHAYQCGVNMAILELCQLGDLMIG